MAKLSATVKKIPIEEVVTNNKKFNLSLKLKKIGLWPEEKIDSSFQTYILSNPVLLKEQCLIDGYKRLYAAKQLSIKTIPAIVSKEFYMEQIALYLLFDNLNTLTSAASKAIFLSHLYECDIDIDFILKNIMAKLGLGPNRGLLEKYIKIATLPQNVLFFCHKKGISFKKTLNFTTFKPELLNWLFNMQGKLALTVSICHELLENINDILRRDDIELDQLLTLSEIKNIIDDNNLEPNRRTNLLRSKIKSLRYPKWTKLNTQMKEIKKQFFKDSPVDIVWDESLENRKLLIKSELTSQEDLEALKKALNSKKVDEGIKRLFYYL